MSETINKEKLKTIRKFSCKLKQESFGNLSGEEVRTLAFETAYNEDHLIIKEVRYNRNGETEEIHEYSYDTNNKVIFHRYSMPMDGVEEAEKMERDEKGRLTREVKLYGSEEGESVSYSYDEKGNVVAAEFKDEEGALTLREDFVYNDQGNLVSRKITDLVEGKNKLFGFIYNDKKNLSEQVEMDSDGALISKTVYEQDENGNDISIVQYTAKNEITQRVNSTYNEQGKQIRRIARGGFTRIIDYVYDEQGNVVDETTRDENGAIISRNSFEFDEHNRLVFETYYEIDLTHSGRDTNIANRYEYEFY